MAQESPVPSVGATQEFRAVVACSFDPCSYCRTPGTEHVQKVVFGTRDEALEHGRAMASNVYGASVHRVGVQERDVSPWRTTAPVPASS